MPYTITIEPTFLRIVVSGAVTNRELQLFADDLVAIEVPCAITPRRLADLSAMPYLTYPAIHALVERRKAQPVANLIKSALVARRPIHFGLARMFQTLNEHPQIRIESYFITSGIRSASQVRIASAS
jgi:hypothetical protein